MDAYDRCTTLVGKNLADSIAIYGRGREILRPPTYILHDVALTTSPQTARSLKKE
jgi:hypothetical protein